MTAQRAHANFTENLTPFMATLLASGTRYPVQAAAMGAGWLVSRMVYTAGCKLTVAICSDPPPPLNWQFTDSACLPDTSSGPKGRQV